MANRQLAVTLEEQITELKRELGVRQRFYPQWIDAGRIKRDVAEKNLARLMAAIETLQQAADMYATKVDMQRLKSVFVAL